MEQIKTILSVYLLLLLCAIVPSIGLFLINIEYARIYLAYLFIITPIFALISIAYEYKKATK